MSDSLLRVLLLQDPNTRIALAGTALLGILAGLIGTLAVLRRRALVGDAVAHAALPGLWIAFFIMRERHFAGLLLGAAAAGTLGILAITFLRRYTRVKEDAAIGIVLGVFFAAGMCLSRIIPTMKRGNYAGLETFIFGKAASMLREDVWAMAIVTVAAALLVSLFFKELRLLCFDSAFAATQGWPVAWLDLALMTLLVISTVIGLPAVGVVLMAALLIIPAAAARFWTDRLGVMMLLSAILGCVAALVGGGISALYAHVSTGPAIVLAAAALFFGSMLLAPRRGVVADLWRRTRLQRKIGLQNLLRTAFEIAEMQGLTGGAIPLASIIGGRGWTPREAHRQLRRARRQRLIDIRGTQVVVTAAGREAALRVVRAHRLWEAFLVEQAVIAPDHVDRDADQIEHILSPELIRQLEERLREQGRLPRALSVPPSLHVLEEAGPCL